MSTEKLLRLLNLQLQNQPNYESWMEFTNIENVSGVPQYRYILDPPVQTTLVLLQIKKVYTDTVHDCTQ